MARELAQIRMLPARSRAIVPGRRRPEPEMFRRKPGAAQPAVRSQSTSRDPDEVILWRRMGEGHRQAAAKAWRRAALARQASRRQEWRQEAWRVEADLQQARRPDE